MHTACVELLKTVHTDVSEPCFEGHWWPHLPRLLKRKETLFQPTSDNWNRHQEIKLSYTNSFHGLRAVSPVLKGEAPHILQIRGNKATEIYAEARRHSSGSPLTFSYLQWRQCRMESLCKACLSHSNPSISAGEMCQPTATREIKSCGQDHHRPQVSLNTKVCVEVKVRGEARSNCWGR